MVNKQQDWQAAFGQPSAAFTLRVQQTLQQLKEEKPMKKGTLRAAVIALALLLAAAGTVYAASAGWNLKDYFDNVFGGQSRLPQNFETGFEAPLTQQVGEILFTLQDAYLEAGGMNAVVQVERADGKPALFLFMESPEDGMNGLFRDGRQDERTIGQYAKEKGLELVYVDTSFSQTAVMDFWMDEAGRGCFLCQSREVESVGGLAALEWQAGVQRPGEEWTWAAQHVTLKEQALEEWHIPVHQAVEGLPVTLDALTLRRGKAALYVDLTFSNIPGQGTPAEQELIADGLWFELLNPETMERLPNGISLGGGIEAVGTVDGKTTYRQAGDSLTADFAGDTLVIRAYDCWEKTRFGAISVKIK